MSTSISELVRKLSSVLEKIERGLLDPGRVKTALEEVEEASTYRTYLKHWVNLIEAVYHGSVSPEEADCKDHARKLLENSRLTAREVSLLNFFFGLDTGHKASVKEAGAYLSLSETEAVQFVVEVINKIRKAHGILPAASANS